VSTPRHLRPDPLVRPTRVRAASGELAALVATPPPEAEPRPGVLLVPGYTGSKEDFWHLLPLLARAGRPATAVDLRGQHESGGPDDPSAYGIETLAADIRSLLGDSPAPLHLLGHSFGGLVCRSAVLSGAPARSLTLLGSGPGALGGHRAALTEAMRPLLLEDDVPALWEATVALAAASPDKAAAPPEVKAFLERRFLASPATALLVMGEDLTTAKDDTDALAATGTPVLVACGENDDAWSPSEQREMAERLGAPYVVFSGAGHSPNVDAPEAVAESLASFWSPLD
jgi:pimeloyl-ACP methyl ester carboxylesterase